MYIKNMIKHFNLITKHKWIVFKLSVRAGIPIRGFLHDFSKYSPEEFFEGVKYYIGIHSPITECKKKEGYSKAWLHHRGRNKHHPEYWYDEYSKDSTPIIPCKYVIEMLCDKISASKIYKGKEWSMKYQIEYWDREKEILHINENVKQFISEVFDEIDKLGIKKVLKRQNLKKLYKKHCE